MNNCIIFFIPSRRRYMMLAHDHHLLLRTCDNQKYYSFFYNLHPMQNTTPCNAACPGLKGEITNSNWHLKLFPDEIEGWDNQNIFWCQLPTGTWHWHQDDRMKTGNWCGETGALMGSLTIPTVLTINAFSSCAICNFVLWKSFCFVYDAGN